MHYRRHFQKVCHSYKVKGALVQPPTGRCKNRRIRFLVPGRGIPRCADESADIARFLRSPASVLQIYSASLFFDSVSRVYGYLGGAPAVYMSTADATIEGSGAMATDMSFPS